MKRWPGIRHKFVAWWNLYGQHLGAFPNPSDIDHLDRIWRGEA